jgi:hypothetical protein
MSEHFMARANHMPTLFACSRTLDELAECSLPFATIRYHCDQGSDESCGPGLRDTCSSWFP